MVDWMGDICAEVAAEEGQSVRLALLYSEQTAEGLAPYLARGEITPLPPADPLKAETLEACDHIVALMGYEPFASAIEAGADIVIAGRTTDTAVLAAVPLMRGFPVGACWHAAKTAECGGLCTTHSRQGGVMLTLHAGGFDIEPLSAGNQCTPWTVSAHMLYENSDPYELREPGVILTTYDAVYTALDDRSVRVTGSAHKPMPYTMKLEGSGVAGYRTMLFAGLADPKMMADLDGYLARMRERLVAGVSAVLGYADGDYDLQIRAYGHNALAAPGQPKPPVPPSEVGIMMLVTADEQATATEIAKFANPLLLHFPLKADDPLPSSAFPFSPAEVELGAVYEFKLQHVVATATPHDLVRTRIFDLKGAERHVVA
jgi:hypothetical protein